jgi:hypothetical protein
MSIYAFCIIGWSLLYWILLEVAIHGGSHTFIFEIPFEFWSEMIATPILIIVLVIFIIIEVKSNDT